MLTTIAAFVPPAVFLLLLALEALFPARRRPFSLRWRLQGVAFFAVGGAIGGNLPKIWKGATAGVSLLGLSELPLVPSVLLLWVTMGLALYWLHRARHALQPLWRLHQMHHSAERFDVSGAFFTHPIEVCYIPILATVVGTLLLGVSAEAATVTAMIGFSSAAFQHCNVRTPRWLGYIIQRPESHSVHHARGVHAFNYCDLPLLDMLFGTFRNPPEHEEHIGFWDGASRKLPHMLVGIDVTARSPSTAQSAPRSVPVGST